MKILRIKLENFIGIKHGTGKDEIEIDLTKGKNKMVLLKGGNGSGKSTILAALHPYKESLFDDRKNLILDGKKGRKEIDYEYNGHKYEISHTYCKMAQSFIKRDGVELNPNGGLRTFEDIVGKELGINKDYFQIGRIGSNTKNFVDNTTVDRKLYISTFLNIDDIVAKYKVVKDKYNSFKKDMATIGQDLAKFKEKGVMETEISVIEKDITEIDAELSVLYKEQGSLTTTIERDKTDIGSNTLEDIQARIDEKTKDLNDNLQITSTLKNELKDLDKATEVKETLTKEISQLQTDIQVNNNEQANKTLLLTDCKNKITSTNIELSSLGNPEDIQKLDEQISTLEKSIETLAGSIKNNPVSKVVNNMRKSKDTSKILEKFTTFTNFVEKYFSDLSQTSITNNRVNIEYFFDADVEESFKRQIDESKEVLDGKQKLLEAQQKERGIKEGYVGQLDNLNKRPHQCTIDDCPFIKDAICHKNVLKEIADKDIEIAQTKKEIEVLETKAENLQTLSNLYKNFNDAYTALNPRDNDIFAEFIKEKSLIDYVKGSLSDFQNSRQTMIENVNNAIVDINNYIGEQGRLEQVKRNKKQLEDSDSSVRAKYEKDLETLNKEQTKLEGEYSVLKDKATVLIEELTAKQELLSKYNDYTTAVSKQESARTMLSTANSEFKRVKDLTESKTTSETKLAEVTDRINVLNTSKNEKNSNLINLKTALIQLDDLTKKKTNLEKSFKPIETITAALNPSSGIPLIMIKTYLDETEAIANELLDIAYGGDFKINFVLTEKEFSIKVIAKNNIKDDIKLASQGEMSLTTISISLALIEQSLGAYNILCLDEIDGPLDPDNRNNFINILNQQISRLGIEQVFIISHNDAFDTAETDLILLPRNDVDQGNASFMKNKTVIFEEKGV